MNENLLQTRDLSKKYKDKYAVDHVGMTIRRGDIYGFIGRNGAGKTTFIRMLTGLINKSKGSIFLTGAEKKGMIGAVIEGPACYPYLSAAENIHYYAIQRGISDKQREREVLELVRLKDIGRKKFRDFSLGMKQRLGIALAILSRPELLILDEPTNGLDPEGIIELREIIRHLNKEDGMTILISSHILGELSMVADRYGVIEDGRLIREFTMAEISDGEQDRVCAKTLDNRKACVVLGSEYQLDEDRQTIRIRAGQSELETIGRKLYQAGICITELYSKSTNLEEYFLTLTGGQSR